MNMSSSRRRFRQRIEIERRILYDVNRAVPFIRPLSAITEESVCLWLHNAHRDVPPSVTQRIARIINEISKRVALDTDCSRDVFEDGELLPMDSIGELLIQLEEEINAFVPKQR